LEGGHCLLAGGFGGEGDPPTGRQQLFSPYLYQHNIQSSVADDMKNKTHQNSFSLQLDEPGVDGG
jgi:hypothetical protein